MIMFDLKIRFRVNKAILISLSPLVLPVAIAAAAPTATIKEPLLTQTQIAAIEPAILTEINRARTQPQAYADWLEQQQQYYNGAVLNLPGEATIRTNRGFKALKEAIAFLRQQQPLPPLTSSEDLTAAAQTQLAAIADLSAGININIDNISYSLVTPQAIVMQMIVDDRFPDRRRRLGIFAPEQEQTGIACQPDPRYSNICAIAYQPISEAEIAAATNNATASSQLPNIEETTETDRSLPAVPSPTEESVAAPNLEPNNLPDTETAIEIEVPTIETAAEASDEEPESGTEVTTTPSYSQLLEKVERGTLAAGDKTIPEDGSFYDSYPLEGQAGESFIISLESDDFDTFVAILDAEGNIIEQNDDISDDNSNSRLRVTLPDDGVYSVLVNAYDRGGTGSYILTIRR